MKITGRTSSITNAFVNSIIPVVEPTETEIRKSLRILGMSSENIECAYCGAVCSEWDHLRPLVADKKPTGYISEIRNLVPACGKCNQSKGNKNWRAWMKSTAKLSPASKKVPDLQARIDRLEKYESWGATKVNIAEIVGKEDWSKHWENHESLTEMMRKCQEHSEILRRKLKVRKG